MRLMIKANGKESGVEEEKKFDEKCYRELIKLRKSVERSTKISTKLSRLLLAFTAAVLISGLILVFEKLVNYGIVSEESFLISSGIGILVIIIVSLLVFLELGEPEVS